MIRFASNHTGAAAALRALAVGVLVVCATAVLYASGANGRSSQQLLTEYKVTIVQPPQDVSVCEGKTATFSVQATTNYPNPQFAYQWYDPQNNLIQDGGKYSGATTNTLTISNVTQNEAGQYTVVVSVTNGQVTPASAVATLRVLPGVQITSQPQNVEVCEGEQATASVGASGTGLSYQWYANGVPIPGATTSSIAQTVDTRMNGLRVFCLVANDCDTVSSDTITVTVKAKTTITQQPQGGTVQEGQPYTFTVQANGSNLRYQWFKDGNQIVGATGSSYQLSNARASDRGRYYVVVTGDCGTVTSDTVTLDVILSVEAEAYALGYRLRIDPQPASDKIVVVMNTPTAEPVTIELVDVAGRRVATLWQGVSEGSEQRVEASVGALVPGVYRCVLRSNAHRISTPLVVVR